MGLLSFLAHVVVIFSLLVIVSSGVFHTGKAVCNFIYRQVNEFGDYMKKNKKEKINLNDYCPCAAVERTECCGMAYLSYLDGGPIDCLASLASWQNYDGNYKPLVVFADATCYGNGARLATFIRKNDLGEVFDTGPGVHNPNSGNKVKAYLWKINQKNWNKFVKDRFILPRW